MLLIDRLNTHVPDTVLNKISTCTDQFEINSALRLAHFLAQCAFSKAVDDDILNNPDLVKSVYPLFCSAWFWNTNKLNVIADLGSTMKVVKKMIRKINGGLNGLDERLRYFEKYFALLK